VAGIFGWHAGMLVEFNTVPAPKTVSSIMELNMPPASASVTSACSQHTEQEEGQLALVQGLG
jgi:hypothetical protein